MRCSREVDALIFVAYGVGIVLAAISALILLVAAWRGYRRGRREGDVSRHVARNLLQSGGLLMLVLVVLPVSLFLLARFSETIRSARHHQGSTAIFEWMAPLWDMEQGDVTAALDAVLDAPKARESAAIRTLLETLPSILQSKHFELTDRDRVALATMPSRLRPRAAGVGSTEIASKLGVIDGLVAWMLHRPEAPLALERCKEAACAEGVATGLVAWCVRHPVACRKRFDRDATIDLEQRLQAMQVSPMLIREVRRVIGH